MSNVILQMSVSLDGFFEDAGGGLGWNTIDEEIHRHFNDELGRMGAFLEGRATYELMESYWPTADADAAAPPWMREFAGIWRDMPKVVYSRTLQMVGPNATLVREVVPEEVRALKAKLGGDLVIGGANLAETFLRHGLVDEYRIYVHPVVLGAGRPLFQPSAEPQPLRLIETRTFASGVVQLRYAPA